MMRGADHWAVAVRKPSGDIHVESHDIDSVAKRHPFFGKPFLRGVIVLGQSLAIGTRALLIARASTGARVAGLPPDPCSAMTTPSPAGEAAAAGVSVTICTSRRR